ncbi:uncharacterized protein LOC128605761 [Ictalurus furcatus]|uniref:uncharacterized protein LOC128605761 n=1 Tax=Ictalurus furcatus TaxID=66913 RepID=UPI00234FE1BE|nr:uncharacterized protein LOC128605761 [Ictalurus furcatus]
MSKNSDLRNDTYDQVETIINKALNTLLNEPGAEPFEPQSSFITSSGNQVNGDMDYYFQDGATKTPAAFQNELTPVSGSAVVQTRMVFNSSSPVPSESLVLSAIQTLLSARLTNLSDSVKVLNFTYENISDTSYAVNFTLSISNISMSKNPDLRNDTYTQVENIINNALNTLLNEPGAEAFEPQSSFFTSSGNQINGDMEYYFQDEDTKTPAAFLNELKSQSLPISGSAVVQTRMVFNSSSPVPSESLVLSAIQTLLSARLTNLSDSVKVLNFTYEKISDTSYAVNFTLSISNISMSKNPDLRNDTYTQVENIINNALNTLLNEPGAEPFEPQSSFITSSGNQVNGDMDYYFKDGATKTPAAFQNELTPVSSGNQVNGDMDYYFQDGATKTPAAFQNELTPVSGSAVVQTRMVFNSSSPVPSESLVLSAIQTLLSARLTNLSDSVKVLNFTYENISDTSYAVNFTLSISNISMSKNPDLRNDTYTQVENIINNALNTLLNEPGAEPFEPQSSFITSSGNQVNGDMDYYFQDGATKTPAAFQNELTPVSGSAVVQTRMVFNSSSPVPSESLVLSAIQTLLSARLTNLSDSVKVLNFTYENISDTSYAVNFTLSISNISMSKNPDLRNDTYTQVENIINNALNTLLNEPGAEPFEPQSSFITSSGNQVNGDMDYYFKDGATKTPAAFQNELTPVSSGNQVNGDMDYYFQDGATKTPAAFQNELTPVSGSAVVQTRMVFNSSSPVPSESLVLSAIQTLLSARLTNLSDSVKVLNFTYENISDTSYAVNFTLSISNISMSKNPDLRNDTYTQVENIINNALNTLLNEPGAEPFEPQSSFITSSGNQVNGDMDYYFQDGATKTPAAFQNELTPVSGSAVVQTRMVFNSSSPVPSESLVLSAIQTLLSARLTNLSDSVKVLNFTYENISDTSYAVNFTLSISNISMSKNPDLRNDTYTQVENIINNALNTLLNEPGAEPFEPQSSFITSSGNQVNGDMDYYFQDGATKTPAAFQNELTPVSGSAVVQTRMVFNSSSPVPSESLVLSAIQTLLSARLTNLSDSVKVLNFTYENISDTSYAVNFTLSISNISMSKNPDLRNDTYTQVENIINNALNTLLNEPGAEPFEPQSSFITSSGNQVNGDMDYYFKDGATKTPAAFQNELTPVSGSAVVQTRMVFNSSSPVPSERLVLSAIQTLLSARLTNLSDSVKVLNFTYENISDTSYAVNFTLSISNISMSKNPDLRNDTYTQVENIINNALNTLLNEPGAEPFEPQSSFITSSGNQVNGDMDYYFQDGATKTPAAFQNELTPV